MKEAAHESCTNQHWFALGGLKAMDPLTQWMADTGWGIPLVALGIVIVLAVVGISIGWLANR